MSPNSYSQFGLRGRAPRGVTGELSPASVYVSLLPVVEACVVVAVPGPGRVGEVRVTADEPGAVDLDPGVLARRLDAPATVKAVLEQGGRVLLRSRAVRDPGPSGGRVCGVAKQRPSFLRIYGRRNSSYSGFGDASLGPREAVCKWGPAYVVLQGNISRPSRGTQEGRVS